MIATFTLLLAVSVDPRPALVELQLQERPREALSLAQHELADHPAESRRIGLDYLRGQLLHLLGDDAGASEAFGEALTGTPDLALYSRYRMALEQEAMGHSEVAAGLVASVVERAVGTPLLPDAVGLFTRSLARGGDCYLLRGLAPEKMPTPERRALLLAQADCARSSGLRELSRNLLVRLLEENREDDPGRLAADRLALLVPAEERGRAQMLLGLTFYQHHDFTHAMTCLSQSLGGGDALPPREVLEVLSAEARSLFWQQMYAPAAEFFGQVAQRAHSLRDRSRALFQEGLSYELLGQPKKAAKRYQLAYLADPPGEWGAAARLAELRLEWRAGDEVTAAAVFYSMSGRPEWREPTLRAGLFLAASDIVRGRADRAGAWLDHVVAGSADERLEIAYWRGRLAELQKDYPGAVEPYLEALRVDPYHPLSRIALARLAAEPLAHAAAEAGRRLAAAKRAPGLYGAWLLLGDRDDAGKEARRRLRQALLADRLAAPYLRLGEVPIASWPLWRKPLGRPEDKLLALGAWHEGAPAVADEFPESDPSLALTGSLLLSRGGEHARSILQAEALRRRTPANVPLALQPRALLVVLYPFPFHEIIVTQGRLHGVEPDLLAALIREESRFDRTALSPQAARGLTQLTLPLARRAAGQIQLGRLAPEDLYHPEISAALGAAYLAALLRDLGGLDYAAVAAYHAGEPQALLWRSYCYSAGPDEYFTKVGDGETRAYLRRVLTSRAHYAELY